ncbi:MAG: polymorphic toxin-type HINT domain-containing protein, partial [Nitrospiraceae bacterium]
KRLTATFTFADDLVSQTRYDAGGIPSTSFVQMDGFGSTRWLTDAAGIITDSIDYDAFGVEIGRTGATEVEHLYRGERWDANVAAYDLRARIYTPGNGRFLTQDSFAGFGQDPQSLHKYTYTHNDPVNNIDPTGHFTMGEAMATAGTVATLAMTAVSSYDFGTSLYQIGTGQRELSAKEIGIAFLWAYAGKKAGVLLKGFENVLRKSGCLSNSFTPDTLVQTKDGFKAIANIREGDLVLSRNPDSGEDEFQAVSAVMQSFGSKELIEIELDSTETIRATPEHLMFGEGGLVEARHLKVGSRLVTKSGFAVVASVRMTTEQAVVYDLTVEKNRNFFVTESQVLVHNISPCEKAAQALAALVPKACTGVFKCKQFARDFERLLVGKEMNGRRLCLRSRTGRIWSDRFGVIAENGIHVAAQVGEMVFDNLHPDGIPLAEWKSDLGAGQFEDLNLSEEMVGAPGCIDD